MNIYDRIKSLCTSYGITITRLEEICGLSQNSIKKWTTNTPRSDTLVKIADYFNVSLDWICGRISDIEEIKRKQETMNKLSTEEFFNAYQIHQNKKVGRGLQDLRLSKNQTTKQIADIVKTSEECYIDWEQGKAEPNTQQLAILSKFYKIDLIAYLYYNRK